MSATQTPAPVLATKARIGLETAWATMPGSYTTELISISVTPQIKIGSEKFTAIGSRLPAVVSPNEKTGEHSFEGIATYTEAPLFVKSISNDTGTGVDSFTLYSGGMHWPGAAVSAWSLKGDNKSVQLSGSILSKWFATTGTPSSTGMSAASQDVIDQGEVVLAIGGSNLSRWFNWSLDVSNIIAMKRFGGNTDVGAVTQPALEAKFTVEFEANATNKAFLDQVGTELAWSITCTKANPAKSFVISGVGRIGGSQPFKDNDGVYGYGVVLDVTTDGTSGITVASS